MSDHFKEIEDHQQLSGSNNIITNSSEEMNETKINFSGEYFSFSGTYHIIDNYFLVKEENCEEKYQSFEYGPNHVMNLPNLLLVTIFSYLPVKDIISISLTCKKWFQIYHHPTLQKIIEKEKKNVVTIKKVDLRTKLVVQTLKFPLDNVLASELEEKFQLVKCHLIGDDHSAHFPNKETGKYTKLKPDVIYRIIGNVYDPNYKFKVTPKETLQAPSSPNNNSISLSPKQWKLLVPQLPSHIQEVLSNLSDENESINNALFLLIEEINKLNRIIVVFTITVLSAKLPSSGTYYCKLFKFDPNKQSKMKRVQVAPNSITKNKTNSPEWNHTFPAPILMYESFVISERPKVEIEIWNKELFTNDQLTGTAAVQLSSLSRGSNSISCEVLFPSFNSSKESAAPSPKVLGSMQVLVHLDRIKFV